MMAVEEMDAPTRMRVLLAVRRVKQQAVAIRLGIATDAFSKMLNGKLALPEGFEERFNAAVDALAPAEDAEKVAA